jgi:acetylglutamate kinase
MKALGVSGVDLGLLRAPLLDEDRLGRVGGAPIVHVERLGALLQVAPVLVIAPVSLGPDGRAVNVNADDAAHAIAAALGAESLDFVSDIPGVRDGADRVAKKLLPAAAEALIESGVAHGGMVPKLRAAVSAIEAGVGRVRIGDLTTLGNGSATEISVAVGSSS